MENTILNDVEDVAIKAYNTLLKGFDRLRKALGCKVTARDLKKTNKEELEVIKQKIRVRLYKTAEEAINYAYSSRSYMGFTGNLQTSYSVGIYEDGVLLDIYSTQDFLPPPVSPKLSVGLHKYNTNGSGDIKEVYEHPEISRRVYALYNSDSGNLGADTAATILRNWKFDGTPPKFALVFTTGAGYGYYVNQKKNVGAVEAHMVIHNRISNIKV